MLPLILSFLGSGAAGAGLLGGLSPLIAGAVGSGLGTAIETGDIGKGLQAGLLGGLGGAVLGGALGGGAGTAAADAAKAGTQAASGAAAQGATSTLARQAAAGAPAAAAATAPTAAAAAVPPVTPPTTPPATGGGLFGGNGGMFGFLKNMPSGLEAGAKLPAGSGFKDIYQQGLKQGALTRAGLGSALTPSLMPGLFQKDEGDDDEGEYKPRPQAAPRERKRYTPGAAYDPGRSGEFLYFDPYPIGSNYAEGGLVRMAMGGPIEMQGGGIAELPQGDELFPQVPQAAAPRMNERELVSMTIKAVREELPEEQAAVVLAQFVQAYGEDALRKLVSDVSEGRTQGGDMEGQIEGPGDGMDDLVPAQMDDGSMDVLLSDGEFIVPADVVSGLGNGSTDAGAAELEDMMSRVRQERTGMTRQPKQVAAGGLLPA